MIEDEMAEGVNEDGVLDVVSIMAYEQHKAHYESYIERVAALYMDFWAHLLEDNPDLGKIHELGTRIS